MREQAQQFITRGWVPIPIQHRGKRPGTSRGLLAAWQRVTIETALANFNAEPSNVGVLLGEPSQWLVDIDLDCAEARELAPLLLPATSTFGRASSRRSHWLYVAEGAATEKFIVRSETILELRSTGCQTVFPPSVHVSGENIEYEQPDAQPLTIAAAELRTVAAQLAAAALLVRNGASHDAAIAFVKGGQLPDGVPALIAALARNWLAGAAAAAPAPHPAPAPRRRGELARTYNDAVAAWNADHRLDLPRHSSRCPVCNDSASFGRLPDDDQRWYCFSTDHPDNVGLASDRGHHGDALDLDAFFRGITQKQVLIDDGYYSPAPPKRERAAEPPPMSVPPEAYADDAPPPPDEWPSPRPLACGVLSVPAFEAGLLPEALREWICDIAERAQCPIEYVAVGAIVALGAVVGRKCAIRPKRHDDWTVVANLWAAAVGPPGVMKTPALREALRPLDRLAVRARKRYDEDLADFEFRAAVAKAKREQLQSEIKQAIKNGVDPTTLRSKLAECEASSPTERRYVVNDTTVEKLGELLNENPNGLLLFRDELMGFLRTLERDGHEGDRAFYLEAWSGTSGFTYDRIGRGTTHIEAACVSLLGGIQPGPLEEYLVAAARGGAGDDGLVQRFQLIVSPDVAGEWRNVDRWPDTEAKNRAFAIFERLDAATFEGVDAGADGLRYLRFAPDAQVTFDAWRAELERRLRSTHEAPVIVSHLSKYRKLAPALALIFHLAECAWRDHIAGPVSAAAAELALRWCAVLEAHARRIYGAVVRRADAAAELLSKRLGTGKLAGAFTARDVRRHGWAGLTAAEDVADALDVLEEHGWLRTLEVRTGGRPKLVYEVNPAVIAARGRRAA